MSSQPMANHDGPEPVSTPHAGAPADENSWWGQGHVLAERLEARSRQEGPRAVLHFVDLMIDRFERHQDALRFGGRERARPHIVERALAMAADAAELGQPQPDALARELQSALSLGRRARVSALLAAIQAEARRILGWLRLWRALNSRAASLVRFTLG